MLFCQKNNVSPCFFGEKRKKVKELIHYFLSKFSKILKKVYSLKSGWLMYIFRLKSLKKVGVNILERVSVNYCSQISISYLV